MLILAADIMTLSCDKRKWDCDCMETLGKDYRETESSLQQITDQQKGKYPIHRSGAPQHL